MAGAKLRNVLSRLGSLVATQHSEGTGDHALLSRFLTKRDETAFAALMERHGPMVLGVCERVLRNPHDAEDACQATFLVLARKAGSIRRWQSLGSWLHGVAWRVSRKLLTSLARRRTHENAAAAPAAVASEPADLSWREVRRLVDEELDRLPEHYKAPLLLCHLEGRTHDEAARELGWPLGTLRGRLERGRQKLRARLIRRGVTASAVAAVSGLTPALCSAAAPPTLVVTTVNSSVAVAAGAIPATVAPNVVALTEEMLRAPLFAKLSAMLAVGSVAAAVLIAAVIALSPPEPATDNSGEGNLGTEVRVLEGPNLRAWSIAFSPDGKMVACGFGGYVPSRGELTVWDAATGKSLYSVETSKSVRSVAFSPDSKKLATAEHDSAARVRDAATGEVLLMLKGHKSGLDAVSFAADGKTVATASWDRTIKIWDAATGDDLRTLFGHAGQLFTSASHPLDPNLVASGCSHSQVRVWRADTGAMKVLLSGHRSTIHGVAFSPDGKTLATASWDKTVKLWKLETGELSATLYGHKEKVLGLAFSADGRMLVSGGGKWSDSEIDPMAPQPGEVIVWDLTTHQPRGRLLLRDRVFGVAFSRDGTLATASWDGIVKLWGPRFIAQLDGKLKEGTPERPQQANQADRADHDKEQGKDQGKAPPANVVIARDPDETPPQKDYAQEFYRPLQGEPDEKPGFVPYGPAADECVKFEPEGVRIGLPAGYQGKRPGTGLVTDFGVKGDFEITVSFEMLREPAAKDSGPNTELSLVIVPRHTPEPDVWVKANQNRASLARQGETPFSLRRFVAMSTTWNEETVTDQWGNELLHLKETVTPVDFPTGATKGRLRLVRSGSFLFYCVAEGDSDTFRTLRKTEFGTADLKNVRILASTGGPRASLDVRLTDWRIRADDFPRKAAVTPPTTMPMELILGASVLAVGLAVGGVLWLRHRRDRTRSTVDKPGGVKSDATAYTSFRCADCGKTLKVKKDMAGKKVKCPHCGKTGLAPGDTTTDPNSAAVKPGKP
ncbi:MAG: sigma-70 family RNA polymerase sigma factor [Gemmataceae bacterium]|nr:sigma-70 family RNA polymerase sigma factor [Gemmataceae bacterium]